MIGSPDKTLNDSRDAVFVSRAFYDSLFKREWGWPTGRIPGSKWLHKTGEVYMYCIWVKFVENGKHLIGLDVWWIFVREDVIKWEEGIEWEKEIKELEIIQIQID